MQQSPIGIEFDYQVSQEKANGRKRAVEVVLVRTNREKREEEQLTKVSPIAHVRIIHMYQNGEVAPLKQKIFSLLGLLESTSTRVYVFSLCVVPGGVEPNKTLPARRKLTPPQNSRRSAVVSLEGPATICTPSIFTRLVLWW